MIKKYELIKAFIYDNSISPMCRKYLKKFDNALIKMRKNKFNKQYLSTIDTHKLIANNIINDTPCMLGRLGNTERHIIAEYLMKKNGIRRHYSKKWKSWLLSTSGFFCNNDNLEKEIDKLATLFLNAMKNSDIEAIWDYDYESIIINEYASNSVVTNANSTLIYSEIDNSWGKALRGKKVLFVSPFEESIKYQYPRRKEIWGKYNILPDFKLLTYKTPYTAAGNHPNNCSWFDIFNIVVEDIKKLDFDIAILGCGVYGYPLAAEIKKMKKIALQMCGETQIILGIIGKRWEDGGYVDKFKNEYWIHPIDEKPLNYNSIERGCYW